MRELGKRSGPNTWPCAEFDPAPRATWRQSWSCVGERRKRKRARTITVLNSFETSAPRLWRTLLEWERVPSLSGLVSSESPVYPYVLPPSPNRDPERVASFELPKGHRPNAFISIGKTCGRPRDGNIHGLRSGVEV